MAAKKKPVTSTGHNKLLNTLKNTGKDVLVLLVGAAAGAAAGKWGAALGVPLIAYGNHTNNQYARSAGGAMIVVSGYQAASPVNGLGDTDYGVEGIDGLNTQAITNRVTGYFNNWKEKLLFTGSKPSASVKGIGEMETYYSANQVNGLGEGDWETNGTGRVIGTVGNLQGSATSGMEGLL